MKYLRILAIAFTILAVLYFAIIPLGWTAVVHGKTGIHDAGGKMKISGVIPWPDRNLWCYEGTWINDDEPEPFECQDGTVIIIPPSPDFHGYSYVWEMELQ